MGEMVLEIYELSKDGIINEYGLREGVPSYLSLKGYSGFGG